MHTRQQTHTTTRTNREKPRDIEKPTKKEQTHTKPNELKTRLRLNKTYIGIDKHINKHIQKRTHKNKNTHKNKHTQKTTHNDKQIQKQTRTKKPIKTRTTKKTKKHKRKKHL